MGRTLSVRLEAKELEELNTVSKEWKTDKSETIRRLLAEALKVWKTRKALEELKEHRISIGLAAKRAGLNLWGMLTLVKQEGINWTGYNKEDLKKDLKAMEGKR